MLLSPATWSLGALLVAVVLSCTSRINVGLVALALAWLVGVFAAGFSAEAVASGFPAALFLTLAGVTLLFALAEANGTLETLVRRAASLCGESPRVLPVLFFALACAVASVGPGAIASVALVAPLAAAAGERGRVPPFLTALMVANGANAGNLSPLSAVGVIANTALAGAGLGGHEGKVFLANFLAHVLVGAAAYGLLAGRSSGAGPADGPASVTAASSAPAAFGRRQGLTLAVLAAWVAVVTLLKAHLGLSAFAAGAVLVLARAADERRALERVPWGVILMVSGVTTLVAVLEKAGGLDLFTAFLARSASPASVDGVLAFVTGLVSTYSSTSGVVLPAFLPTVPGIVEKLGGGDPLAVALSINVGASMVDVSPLSTLGALCVAAVPDPAASRELFRKLLLWGLAMTVVGALLCQLFAGALARA
jgi:di/tricarboxylate transporter